MKQPQYLENYSFDFREHQLPIAYDTYGTAVQLHDHFVLTPEVKETNGALVMN